MRFGLAWAQGAHGNRLHSVFRLLVQVWIAVAAVIWGLQPSDAKAQQPPQDWCYDASCKETWPDPITASDAMAAEHMVLRQCPGCYIFRTYASTCTAIYTDTVLCYAGVSYRNVLGIIIQDDWVGKFYPRCPMIDGQRPRPEGMWPNTYCPGGMELALTGGSFTRALPAGPALPMTVSIRRDGQPVPFKVVDITIDNFSFTGSTDEGGTFRFTYVPPVQRAATSIISASCAGCANNASKTIEVAHCEICEPGFGNPIQPATGEKQQDEVDWVDGSPHALTVSRHYRSQGTAPARIGANWSHNWTANLFISDGTAKVTLGNGQVAIFHGEGDREWKASPANRADRFIGHPSGWTYVRASDESSWRFERNGLLRLLSITERNGWTATHAYDADNQLLSVTNAFGRRLVFTYGAGETVVTTPDGRNIAYRHDAGNLVAVQFADGSVRRYHYENVTWPRALTGITDESGQRTATFGYDGAGRALSTEHAGAGRYTVSYGSGPTGAYLTPGHGVDPGVYALRADVTDPLGTRQTYVWTGGDGDIRRLSSSGPFEGETVAARTINPSTGLADAETDFLGVTTANVWDSARKLKLATTHAAGRPEEQTVQTQWHPAFRLPLLVTEAGRTTAYTYDAGGNTLSETVTDTVTGQARRWSWTYEGRGLVESMTDPRGGTWRYAYDAAGNRTSVKDPLGRETASTFDAAGRVLSTTEPGGLVTTYAYDARGRLTSVNRGGEVAGYSYTAHGLLATATMPNGYQVSYGYDHAQRLVSAQDNRGASIAYTLDNAGNRVREEVKDANGNIALATGRVINALNRVSAIQGAQGQTTQLGYDANGERVSETDPLSQTTRQSLDGLRRPTSTTFADNNAATQAWNGLDQLTQVTDPKGVATRYTYNAFGEVMSETSPDIGTMRYTRDGAGDVVAIEDAKGQVNRIERDLLGRIKRIEYAADHVVTYTYDAAGYVSRMEDSSGRTDYVRDALGRITGKTQRVNDDPANPSRFEVGYGYTGGDLTSIRYPSGLLVIYKRTAGRITGIDVQPPGAAAPVPFVSDLVHTALGQPKSWRWSNGLVADRTFDADGRMVSNEFASYGYDAAGRITSITQKLWAQRTNPTTGTTELFQLPLTWTAGYDNRNRLTSFVRDGAETRYTYDANSNRLTAIDRISGAPDLDGVLDGDNKTQSTDQALKIEATSNRLLGFTQTVTTLKNGKTATVVTTPINYAVDANGAMTSDGLRTFDYDASRRLVKVRIIKNGEAASVRYLHNALGQRVFKSDPEAEQTLPNEQELGKDFVNWLRKQFGWLFLKGNSGKTSQGQAFVYGDEDGETPVWGMLGEYDNGGPTGRGLRETIWLPSEDGSSMPLGMFRGGSLYSIGADHLGTSRVISNDASRPVWQRPYSAFGTSEPTGVLAAKGDTSLTTSKPLIEFFAALPGQYSDQESRLSYNINRSFLASHARYTQADPIGIGGGPNRYLYADADPLGSTDEIGLSRRAGQAARPTVSTMRPPPRPARLEPVDTYSTEAMTQCGICLRIYFVARLEGQPVSRDAHRNAGNWQFYEYAGSSRGPQNGRLIREQMENGRGGLRNPSGFEWHHPINRPNELWLVTRCDHRSALFRPHIHYLPGGAGGYSQTIMTSR